MNMKFRLKQWHIYTLIWLWVFLYPVISDAFGSNFQWSEVLNAWVKFIPFLLFFIVHSAIIIPRFPLPKRKVGYVVSTVCLLGIFTLYQYIRFDHVEHSMSEPPAMQDTDRRRMPPPADGSASFAPGPPAHDGAPGERRPQPPHLNKTPAYVMDFFIALLVLGCNLTIMLLFRMQREQEKAQLLERMNLQHELKYLKAQLNPHFLMNMLNNIHTMVEVNPEKAQEMIIDLSKLMRYALYEGARPLVSLSQEANFISNYVMLMKQRCSDKKVSIELSLPEFISEKIMVPPMLSIVFIENAFKHGISYRRPSFIRISLTLTDDSRIVFSCENSIAGGGSAVDDKQYGGIGLENARKRLDLLFGDDYTLDIKTTNDTYCVTFNTPIYDEKHPMPGSGR